MRYVILLLMASMAFAFDDPWKKGTGFDDPFKAQSPQTFQQPQTPQQPQTSQQPQTQPRTPQVPPKTMPESPAMPPDVKVPDQNVTIYGGKINGSAKELEKTLGGMGFYHLGKCGNGNLWVLDPLNACMGVVVNERNNKIAGASTWLSQKCVERQPMLYASIAGAINNDSTRDASGWNQVVGDAPQAGPCAQASRTQNGPAFLGFFSAGSMPAMVDAAMAAMKGYAEKVMPDGREYKVGQSTVFYQFCRYDHKPVVFRVHINDDHMRDLVERMNVLREDIVFSEARITTRFENGKAVEMEYRFLQPCGANRT